MNPDYRNAFERIYRGKRVLVTGHTGFKGVWLSLMLQELGAEVFGIALPADTEPNLFSIAPLKIHSNFVDIRNFKEISRSVENANPEIAFHLAAQPLVIRSYKDPIATYETNVMGTVHLFEALKTQKLVRAIVCITTDKVYRQSQGRRHYREDDLLGGKDPYSGSKVCVEYICEQFRHLFMEKNVLLSVARAGNVLGGGDWSANRILPDLIRSFINGRVVKIRHPEAIRPWQHVLDCIHGYLIIGAHLLQNKSDVAKAWNFGPDRDRLITVREVVDRVRNHFDGLKIEISSSAYPENQFLALDSSMARNELHWHPHYTSEEAIEESILWYKNYYQSGRANCFEALEKFWSKSPHYNSMEANS
ncbi:MAG: CDP-glucose 4,6-dehydratase [Deltaproteobacteria bacterium]|nr:CDP-glucose 4,6-dehydratase [Deltaproteobacteria bacterium]